MWIRPKTQPLQDAAAIWPELDPSRAAEAIRETVRRTPIVRLPELDPAGRAPGAPVILGKLENRQVTGSFKARGALWNLLSLSGEERARGVVASSSGNHGRALAWAAKRVGAGATIVMSKDAYPNKIEACRAEGAEIVLAEDRLHADELAAERAAAGAVWVHPYDRAGTVEGAGTVGVEIAEQCMDPRPDAVVFCVGGGGLSSGSSLALRRVFGDGVALFGAEPTGAATMSAGLKAGSSVRVDPITSKVQGLTPPHSGGINIEICGATLDGVLSLDDDAILAAQRRLVTTPLEGGELEVVEPAGAAAYAAASRPDFEELVRSALDARGGAPRDRALRVVVTVSGGNPSPAQLDAQRAAGDGA